MASLTECGGMTAVQAGLAAAAAQLPIQLPTGTCLPDPCSAARSTTKWVSGLLLLWVGAGALGCVPALAAVCYAAACWAVPAPAIALTRPSRLCLPHPPQATTTTCNAGHVPPTFATPAASCCAGAARAARTLGPGPAASSTPATDAAGARCCWLKAPVRDRLMRPGTCLYVNIPIKKLRPARSPLPWACDAALITMCQGLIESSAAACRCPRSWRPTAAAPAAAAAPRGAPCCWHQT